MKKIAIVGLLSLCAAGVYAQGQINFGNDLAGFIVTHIYAPNPATPGVEQQGNGPGDFPVGTWNYTAFTAIGGSTGAAGGAPNYAFGNNFSVSIYALGEDDASDALTDSSGDGGLNPLYHANGSTLFSSLQPVTTYLSTLSGNSASLPAGAFSLNNPVPDPGIPLSGYNYPNGTVDNAASVSVVCWYNAGNTITSYAAATTDAAQGQNVPYGASKIFNMANLGEPGSVESINGAGPTAPGDMTKLTSFSLISATPEPSTIALGVMGACAFLARRRKK